jgi:hypothetical protein
MSSNALRGTAYNCMHGRDGFNGKKDMGVRVIYRVGHVI